MAPPTTTTDKNDGGQQAAAPKKSGTRYVNRFSVGTVAVDAATAFVVSSLAAVPISIIDLSIMMKVGGVSSSMGEGLKIGLNTLTKDPYHFFISDRPGRYNALVYRVCFCVYFTTYLSANTTRTWYESRKQSKESTALAAGLSSSVVNTGMTVWKDSVILSALPNTMLGASATAYVPLVSKAGFALRDTLTCIAAFTITPLLRDHFVQEGWSMDAAKTTASLATPVSMQFITTAVHIPSIIYQRVYKPERRWSGPEGYSAAIVNALKKDYTGALRLRMGRIFFAFGIGSILASDTRLFLASKIGAVSEM